jgi:hypothetical protein
MSVPPPAEQTSGFLVVQLPGVSLRTFETRISSFARPNEYAGYVKSLRAALPRLAPDRYRGIAREVLDRYWEGEIGTPSADPNREARVMIRERLGPDPNLQYAIQFHDPDLLPDLAFAREVLAATQSPSSWEVIGVARETRDKTPETLGFDIGYWGSDHFSLIGDSMVMPQWHPAPSEDFGELREQAERLNSSLLFDTHEAASRFRDWYLSKPWAESEDHPSEFQVIRVDETRG